jgi:tetratricopeptide (TPR) repeat protein
MRPHLHAFRGVCSGVLFALLANSVAAQVGGVSGLVHDQIGLPIKDAAVLCENQAAAQRFTVTTDDKGRFMMIGLRSGRSIGLWRCAASATGYGTEAFPVAVQTAASLNSGRQAILTIVLKREASSARALPGMTAAEARELQTALQAADQLVRVRQWDAAIAKYQEILTKTPALTVVHLQIGECYRAKKEYDNALAAFNDLLRADPTSEKARFSIGITNLEKGDLKAADETLTAAAEAPGATRDVFYNLGEVKFAKGESDEAGKWYQKAADADPTWGKPVFKLGLVALDKGDKDGASKLFEKLMAVDPTSAEAAQARAVIGQP